MAKLILIFSDGTGQIGGIRPDQRLSNVYKMYRAMRPGPDSPIRPDEQVAFYDPGLGAGETEGITLRRIRNALEASVGTGIDENVIDCYAAIISYYEPGDRIVLIGFSRGAYTVRTVANVMNLCGVPRMMPNGKPVPRFGAKLRKIASYAVKYVYNHGAGKKRRDYEDEREAKAARFRSKYGSEGTGADGEGQGNVQPDFVGVFDTVAALRSRTVTLIASVVTAAFLVLFAVSIKSWPWWITTILSVPLAIIAYWTIVALKGQWKYFYENPAKTPKWWNPADWLTVWKNGHHAAWSQKNYDRYLDHQVRFARDAMSIDEERKLFPRVPWGRKEDVIRNKNKRPEWMKQVWFAGNHSDIGGSYPEDESRLSDISLTWMVDELCECIPDIQIRDELLVTSPNACALQHDEILATFQRYYGLITWDRKVREIDDFAPLHPTVLERLAAEHVSHLDYVNLYRPEGLQGHKEARRFFKK